MACKTSKLWHSNYDIKPIINKKYLYCKWLVIVLNKKYIGVLHKKSSTRYKTIEIIWLKGSICYPYPNE